MRTPSAVVIVSLVAAVAACSRSKPKADARLDRDLHLALAEAARPAPTASPLELAGELKAAPHAPAREGTAEPVHARKTAPTRKIAHAPKAAPAPKPVAVSPIEVPEPEPSVASAPVAAPTSGTATTAPSPEPTAPQPADPAPEPMPRTPPVWGGRMPGPTDVGARMPGMPGGISIPGLPGGGVIILRGGHGGIDPCDEHDHGRGGMDGVIPRLPGIGGVVGGVVGGVISGGVRRGGLPRWR